MNKYFSQCFIKKQVVLQMLAFFIFMLGYAGKSEVLSPVEGPGGPILVITSNTNPFSSYTAEILLAEGFNEFSTSDISAISAGVLTNYDVIIIGEIPLTTSHITLLTEWVDAGGTLIAFRPDSNLAPLLGLEPAGGTLVDSYLLINTSSGPGNGLVNETIQFHSQADLYSLNGASNLATLYSSENTATPYPAVSINNVGLNGGKAVAFTFDLARSIVYTRQGNPNWAGIERDGANPIRANDMFYPDWVNLSKVEIPQADEQQRLLANIIIQSSQKPMPRFWYLPRGLKAAVVMTGDDHARGGTSGRFNQYIELSPDNSPEAVADWRAIRGSSYIYPETPLSDADAKYFEDLGFEIALHLNTGCGNYTPQSIEIDLVNQLSEFRTNYPSLADPVSNRTHCIVYSDWASQPIVSQAHGIRLDANYYYWPDFWVQDRPGLFTGSGLPMRFADLDGTLIDTYQLTTQMTDESGQSFPFTIDRLLDNALGTKGYYGVFCANMHTDNTFSSGSDAIVASALARNVPVISAKQLLTWLDGRNESSFENLVWDGSVLNFSIGIGQGAVNLEAMLPIVTEAIRLVNLTVNGTPVNYRSEKIKGIDYAIFPAQTGNFAATYEVNEPPVVSITSPADNSTFIANEVITIVASASDPDGEITKVEFLSDNIKLGEDLDGTDGWSLNWLSEEAGNYSVTAKATDNKGSFTMSDDVSLVVTIDPTTLNCPCTVFEPTEAPSNLLNEGGGLNLGMKFTSEVDGYVSGVRFYKENGHTGTHTGQLYDNSGNLLAEAVFTNETASGWQEVAFGESVPITRNTTYIISYHSSEGYYSVSDSYFVQTKENTPLKGLVNGEDGPNGVYILSNTPAFPTDSYAASNYWVDVVFNTEPTKGNIPPVITITSPSDGENFSAPATINITASASDADGEVVKVEFYNSTFKLGEDLDQSDGWSFLWNNISAGNYNLIAIATDNQGSTVETNINFTVSADPATQNSIVAENALPGNPSSEWDIDGAGDWSIQGFATDISYNKGETARFKIKTNARAYDIDIYRLGYYQGNGARLQGNATITANLPQSQPSCISNSSTGLLDCGNWEESATWNIPSNAVSGVYIAKLTREDNGGASHIVFVVRDDSSASDLLFQTSDATWQAYNIYGDNNNGRSLYTGSGGKAVKVSYNRPFLTRDGGGGGGAEEDWIFNAEYPMIRWLEANGFDVTYTTNVDSDRRGELIANHKVFLSVGHDEYWSGAHRNAVESARDQGTHLAFFSGNEVYWKTRWENSIDGNGVPYRTLVCYKEGSEGENTCSGKCDPSPEWTGLWRSGCQYADDACKPENQLTGQISWAESDASLRVPSTFRDLRFWRNTSVASLNDGQTASFTYGTIGYEWNQEQEEYKSSYPDGRILLSRTVVDGDVHNISLYKHTSGALVFGAGTVQWSWGLDSNHDRGNDAPSRDMQQATLNLLADMGAQPGSIQPDLITASPSTDFESPVITYSSPIEGATVPINSELVISGTAEEENVLVAVEVSTDNGITWEQAEGTTDWVYSWTPTVEGTVTILTRAFDDSGNLSSPVSLNISVSDEINNANPVVMISEPQDGTRFTAPATINITATASDADGTISKVEFFNGTIKLGEDLTGPYEFNWTNVLAGNYSLTARATDDVGAVTISEAINVSVNSDPGNLECPCTVFEPTVTPAGGPYNDGNALQLGMKFSTTVDGLVTGVKFYKQAEDSGNHIGQLYSSTGELLAEVNFQNETASGWQQMNFPESVEITAGTVYIISYHSSAGYYSADNNGFEQAIINDPVRGLANGENGPNGVYAYSATPVFPTSNYLSSNYYVDVVFETNPGTTNPNPVVAITSPLENDSFTAPADIVITADASDTDGSVVSVEFFEGTNSLGVDSDGSDGWSFTWNAAPQGAYVLTAVATDDDLATTTSAVVNINVEALPSITNFIPSSGPVGSLVLINGTNLEDVTEVSFGPSSAEIISISATNIEVRVPTVNGKLPKDVKITLTSPAGQFTSFNKFTVTSGTAPINAAPVVGIISPANNTMYTAPAIVDVLVDATDSDGTVTKVEFFNGNIKLGEDQSSPYEYQWNNVTAGIYTLTAVATDDKGDTGTSETVNIQVADPGGNLAPEVSITSPVNNESFTAPANISITADALDTDGSITSVEFYNGTTRLGVDDSSPYVYSWNNVPSGTYSLTAIATDNLGAVTTSEVVYITVDPSSTIVAPSNLTAQWVSGSEVSLSWSDNYIGEDGFVLERASKSDFSGKVNYISLPSNSVTYLDTKLNSKKGGGVLYYRIRAVKGNLSSEYSNVAQATSIASSSNLSTESVNADANAHESFFAYPNPTSGETTLEFLFLENINYSLRLFDSAGGFISDLQEGKAEAGVIYYYRFDGKSLSDGLYLIHLETSDSIKSLKLLIER